MAFLINTTSVINNSAQIPWGDISGVPFFIYAISSPNYYGDGHSGAYFGFCDISGYTMRFWYDTNCNCDCNCSNCTDCACDCACNCGPG